MRSESLGYGKHVALGIFSVVSQQLVWRTRQAVRADIGKFLADSWQAVTFPSPIPNWLHDQIDIPPQML